MPGQELPACRECGVRSHWLGTHITEVHGLSVDAYLKKWGPSPTLSAEVAKNIEKTRNPQTRRAHPPDVSKLTTVIAGIRTRVHHDVPVTACLELPEAYRIPTHGALAEDVVEVFTSLVCQRSVYLWGQQGTGKDALIHFYSWTTRTPGLIFQVDPDVDIRSWFYTRELSKDGTTWSEGELLRAIRDGYTSPTTNQVHPYIILLTDFDRATKSQAESLRLVLDSIRGRVKGPMGVTYPVLPGTQIVVTANTAGAGDESGRYVSANVIDSSILDRFDRAYKLSLMDWADEEPILKAKFPILVEKCPGVFPQVGKATESIRNQIRAGSLYTEFSHRAVVAWLGAAQDIIQTSGTVPDNLLKRAFRVVRDKMADTQTRDAAEHLISAHIKGGVLGPK